MIGELLDPAFETMPPRRVRARQQRLWQRQWPYVCAHSAFYRRKFADTSRRHVSLADLGDLPLTDKDELRESGQRRPPFGDHVACDEPQIVRLHRTSGTTGAALNIAWTVADARRTARVGARAMFAAGLRPSDRVVHCLNYCVWTGGLTDHLSLEATGATVVPFGVGNTRRLLETIEEIGVTAISCTPSYPALMEKVLRESIGREPRDLGLRLALFGGEAGLDNMRFRQTLERTWGFAARNANYGLSEVLSQFAGQCEQTNDLHFHAGDVLYAEILDPEDGSTMPIEPGVRGELVLTNLCKQAQPLVRYRTRDLVTISAVDGCPCGRTSWRFRVTARTDDMFNVRGVNVFPAAIHEVLASAGDLTSGHFRIQLRGPGPFDRIEMKVEAARDLPADAWPRTGAALEERIRGVIAAGATITIVPHLSLPRTGGKTPWIERTPI